MHPGCSPTYPGSPQRPKPGAASASSSLVPSSREAGAAAPRSLAGRLATPLLLALLNLSWLLSRAAPAGMPLVAALLLANAFAIYLLRTPAPRAAAAAARAPDARLAARPAPIPLLPASERPAAGSLAGGCPAEFWRHGDATAFKVRTGPLYKRQGLKAPSKAAMYELITVDLVKLNGKLASAGHHVKMPSPLEGGADGPLSPILAINLQMPLTAPAAFGGDDTGTEPTFSIIAYFGCSASAQAEARSGTPSAAVRLMMEYCARAPPPGQSASGTETPYPFKIIAMLENIDELGLPSHIARFNGKPALIRKSGTLHAGEGYLELAVDISKFSYFARRGLWGILDRIKNFSIHAAFLLEGTEDDELPECILGTGRWPFADYADPRIKGFA